MKKTNRVLCMLLAFVMALSMLSGTLTPVKADYSDGDECWHCGHYHWDDYMCPDCGACSGECTNDWCYEETHCPKCGECLMNSPGFCTDCNLCESCMEEYTHCTECGECWADNDPESTLCGNCHRCYFCSPICEECRLCEDCANDTGEGMHCPECGNCYQITEQCMFVENNHCKECCEPCEQCGECIAGDHLETCPDCGLCVECCEFNSMMEGCESGDICVAGGEWDEHVCESCMKFCEDIAELCETCKDAGVYRCKDCCELSSECSENMCEYDEEYDEHFCIDCGECFHDAEICSTCESAGEFRCKDCCYNLTESMGCDGSCGEIWCCNDTYFEQHLDEEHEDHSDIEEHDAFPRNRWNFDVTSHWRDCRFCDEDENEELAIAHRSNKAGHSFDGNGVCTVCGYSADNKPYITRQPKNIRCNTSIDEAYKEDAANGLLYYVNHVETFSVTVRGGKGTLHYQWYMKHKSDAPHMLTESEPGNQFDGVTTSDLKINIASDACLENGDNVYYCIITDDAGNKVTTDNVYIKASHAYSKDYAVNSEAAGSDAAYKNVTFKYQNPEKGGVTTVTAAASNGHRHQCLSETGMSGYHYKTERPVMHTFGPATLLGRSAKQGATEYDKVYSHTCTACGYKTYYETHKHIYYSETVDFERYNRGSFNVNESKSNNVVHALTCIVEGCDNIRTESHEWDWRNMGYGSDTGTGGIFYRECRICGYLDNNYSPVDEDGSKISWTTQNVLVTAQNAQVSRTLAKENDKLTLTINNNMYTLGKRCTGWVVKYTDRDGTLHDITDSYTIEQNTDGTWGTTIKLAGYAAGGVLLFTPDMEECTGHSYVIDGYVAPVCMYDGFVGYSICKYCHSADPADTASDEEKVIPAAYAVHTGSKIRLYQKEVTSPSGKKTITWTTDKSESNGKRYNYVAGDCNTRGCDGDFLCSACNHVIPGKWEYKHPHSMIEYRNGIDANCFRIGNTGDEFCTACNKTILKGEVLPALKTLHGTSTFYGGIEVAATCTTAGKDYDQYCYYCNKLVMSGAVRNPLGHEWIKDEAGSTAEITAYKCSRIGCEAVKFASVVTNHDITVDGGTAYVGGKAVVKADEGVTVTLKSGPAPKGKCFKEWEVIYGGVVIADTISPTTTFTMPGENVKISAVYEDINDEHIHKFSWVIDKEATKTETGLMHEECIGCGFRRSENTVIAKLTGGGNDTPGGGKDTPGENNTPGGGNDQNHPKTGDGGILAGWIAALFVSGSFLTVFGITGKKKKEEPEL